MKILYVILGLAAIAPDGVTAELVAPYVNTVHEDVELLLELAGVGEGDYLIDLGSGDGRIVIAAAQRGASGHGVELDPELVTLARSNAKAARVDTRAAFLHGDIFEADIAAATVVSMYLMPEVNLALRPKLLQELGPGTRVLSNSFDMGEWEPDARAQGRTSGGALLWIVPADVSGAWDVFCDGMNWRLQIRQKFQKLVVIHQVTGLRVHAAMLQGERLMIDVTYGELDYTLHGRVDIDRFEGFVHVNESGRVRVEPWTGQRANDD